MKKMIFAKMIQLLVPIVGDTNWSFWSNFQGSLRSPCNSLVSLVLLVSLVSLVLLFPGIYKIHLSGNSAYQTIDFTQIRVYKNGSIMFTIFDGNEAVLADENNVSYTWIMRLVKGDELKLFSVNYLYASSTIPLTFSGELIHIENWTFKAVLFKTFEK